MGIGASKSVETVKAENFEQQSLRDESMLLINMHLPSSFGGAMLVVAVLGLAKVGHSLSSYLSRLGCSLGELPLLGLTNFVRPNTRKTKNSRSRYKQDVELCMTAIPHVSAR